MIETENKQMKISCDHLYTADKEGHFYTDAVIFVSNGRIDWTGCRKDIPPELQKGDYREYDASGRIAMPGFVNGHGHSNLNSCRAVSDAADFERWAEELCSYTSVLEPEDIEKNNELSVLEMLKGGTTCICDCTRYGAGMLAGACARMGMRCLAGGLVNSPEYRKNGRPNYEDAVKDTMSYKEKFQNDDRIQFYLGAHAPGSCTPEMIRQSYEKSQEIGERFIIHAAETLAEEQKILERTGLRPIPWLESLGVLTERTVLIHCVQINDEDIAIIKKSGCSIIHCPVSNAKLGNGISPVKKLLKNGVSVGLGTDSMLSNNCLDMFREMKMAALVSRLKGKEEALSNEELVKMATCRCAEILGIHNTGSIERGKNADILLLNSWHPLGYNKERFLSDVVFYMDQSFVDGVMVDGKVIYAEGKFTQTDEGLLKKRIEAHYRRKTG